MLVARRVSWAVTEEQPTSSLISTTVGNHSVAS
jgi:hypothetical protein